MEPRLKTSTKWSPFPTELSESAALVLKERFAEEYDLKDSDFVVEGRIYPKEIIGLFGLHSKNQLKQQNFEVSFEYDSEKEKALDLIHKSMDVVEHLWSELLEDDLEDSELLKTWQTMPFEKKMYFFRYTTINTKLEEEADKLLAEYEKKLIYEATPESDIDDDETDFGSSDPSIEVDFDDENLEDDTDNSVDDKPSKKTIH